MTERHDNPDSDIDFESAKFEDKYLVSRKMKSGADQHENLSVSSIKKLEGKEGFEVLLGKVIPYFDFDKPLFKTQKELKEFLPKQAEQVYQALRKRYPGGDVMLFESAGLVDGMWKPSMHARVRKVGYYPDGKSIPSLESANFDESVYKAAGSRQLFRLPYCTKPGRKLQMRLMSRSEEGKWTTIPDIKMAEALGYKYEDWLVQNIQGEKPIKLAQKKLEKKAEIKTDLEKAFETKDAKLEVDLKTVNALCNCLSTKRMTNRDSWIRTLWCIKNIADRSQLDLYPQLTRYQKKLEKLMTKMLPNSNTNAQIPKLIKLSE